MPDKIIIPGKEEISDLALPKHIELDKVNDHDFTLTEEFPEEVKETSAVGMLFIVHRYLYQMTKIWRARWTRCHGRVTQTKG